MQLQRFASLCLPVLILAAIASNLAAQAKPDGGMLRYPDVSSTHIVFVYAGDLWIVSKEGGMASPLASPLGGELNPRFSPDGQHIAFVGNYEGGSDIYVSPAGGGIAERVTYHPSTELLCDWTPDGALLYSTNGFAGLSRMPQLFTISDDTPHPTQLPVPYGTNGAISPDGKWLAYTPYSRDTRTWKRYRGGMASDIWLFNLETKSSKQITDWEGTDSIPMWHGQVVYYLSDAGKNHRLNIWKYDTNSGARSQVTHHADFDVKWPAIGPGTEGEGEIVYQQGSQIHLLNLKTAESKAVEVSIPGDRPRLRRQLVDASDNVYSATVSPKGKRVAIGARGDIWSAPVENGTPRNLTNTSGVAERFPSWSPDGKWIAYFSDATGEYELVIQQSDGRGETKRLTNDGTHWRTSPSWSPDSKYVLFKDKTGALLLHDIASESTTKIDRDPFGSTPAHSWSHDSRWIAYTKSQPGAGGKTAIWVYNIEEKQSTQLTSGYFNDDSPAFDQKGEYLYYQSNRRFSNPEYEDVGTTFVYRDTGVLLALPLQKDLKNPLLPEVDEVEWEEEEDAEEEEGDSDSEEGQDEDSDESGAKEEDESEDAEDGNEDQDDSAVDQSKDPISGYWSMTVNSDMIPPEARNVTMVLELAEDGSLSGSIQTPDGAIDLENPTFSDGNFKAKVQTPLGPASLTASVADGKMDGTVTIDVIGLNASFSATRNEDSDDSESAGKAKKSGKKKEVEPLEIAFEDAERRVIPLPVAPGNFSGLVVNQKNQLIYRRQSNTSGPSIKLFDLHADKPSEQQVVSGFYSFELSGDGKKLLLFRGSSISVTDAAAGKGNGKSVDLSNMKTMVNPREEWQQIFVDAWRMERDFFYDPNMHGVDWKAVRTRYQKMLEDATSRSDVGFVIAEMISELNVGHAYYRGIPDDPDAPSADTAVLGCRLEPSEGKFKIAEMWAGAPWDTDAQNPLAVAGVKTGQYLLDVEGRELTTEENPYSMLLGLAGQLVTLTVSDDATIDDDDERIHVRLPGGDTNLRFRHWIEQNRAMVDKMSDGKVGYIYVTNTGQPGQNDLFRQFYAQLEKEALIIDDRWNGGGQIPTRFIELLNRPTTNFWARRDGTDWRWPPDSHQGPKAMLINGLAGSGGDMFPALFKQNGLGKLIGKRTWGGLVGITGSPPLIDGASVTAPSFAYYELDGTWGIEGHGVDPDIDVTDDPALMVDGGDPQLETAVKHLLEELEKNPAKSPPRPAYPDRKAMGIPPSDR